MTEDGTAQEIASFDAVHRPPRERRKRDRPARRASPVDEPPRPGQEPASFVIVFDELHLAPVEAERGSQRRSPNS